MKNLFAELLEASRDDARHGRPYARSHLAGLLARLPNEDLRAVAIWLHGRMCRAELAEHERIVLGDLERRPLGWAAAETATLFDPLVRRDSPTRGPALDRLFGWLVALPLAAAEGLAPGDRVALQYDLREVRERLRSAAVDEGYRSTIAARLDALIVPGLEYHFGAAVEDGGLPAELLDGDDEFGPAMRVAHADLLSGPGIEPLLRHCLDAAKTRPTRAWRQEGLRRLRAAPAGDDLVAALLTGFTARTPHLLVVRGLFNQPAFLGLVGDGNTELIRGLVWLAALAPTRESARRIGDVGLHAGLGLPGAGITPANPRIAVAAVAALGALPVDLGEAAVVELGRILAKVRSRTVLKAVDTVIADVAARAEVTPERIRECSVPTIGLDATGRREVVVGAYTGTLAVLAPGTAKLTWIGPDGRAVKAVPKAEQTAAVTELRVAFKELRALVASEKRRVEEHLVTRTEWTAPDWRTYYAGHPVTGVLARALIWQTRTGEDEPWLTFVGAAPPASVAGSTDARIRLWHPIDAAEADVARWRAELLDRGIEQPLRQAFREVYRPTPDEAAGATHSTRFAGRVLRYPQVRALLTTRGWTGPLLGSWNGGEAAEMVREFVTPGGEVYRAAFMVEEVIGAPYAPIVEQCTTGTITIARQGRPLPPARVPAVYLSETMRDVALVITVCAADHPDPGVTNFPG